MKKVLTLAVACVAFAALTNIASAQLTGYMDQRDAFADIAAPVVPFTNSEVGGTGGKGSGQIIYLCPQLKNGSHDTTLAGGRDWSVDDLYLYLDYTAAAGEVLAALGLDFPYDDAGAAAGIESLAFEVYDEGTWWDGTATTATGIKAVQVPIDDTDPPTFAATDGIRDNTGSDSFRVAKVTVQAMERCDGTTPRADAGSLGMWMEVNELLCTQVSEAGSGALAMNLGYWDNLGSWEAEPADDTGSVQGTSSPTADATVVVVIKGDYTGDGQTNVLDLSQNQPGLIYYQNNPGAQNILDRWNGDFNNDGQVNVLDAQYVIAVQNDQGCI